MEYLITVMKLNGWYEYEGRIYHPDLDHDFPSWITAIEQCIVVASGN